MLASPTYDLAYGDHPRHRLDVYPGGDTVIVFWHGGSWEHGDKRKYHFVGRALQRLGYTTVVPNYRLYPEVVFPAFVEDAALAASWVAREYRPRTLVAMGCSAGAHIAALLALDQHYLQASPGVRIDGFIGLAGPYDFQPAQRYQPVFGGHGRAEWQPIRYARPKVPVLLFQGQLDPIVPPTNARALAGAIKSAGGQATVVEYRLLEHLGILLPLLTNFLVLPSMRRHLQKFVNNL